MVPLFIVLGIIGVFVALVVTRPKEFRIERSTSIAAPPSVVFDQVNDFRRWEKWSPWAKLDPEMKVTYGGSSSGVGSKYSWAGNRKAGEGRMEIVESRPHERVKILLDFLKPVRATNVTEFRIIRDAGGTQVSWCMAGKRNFGMKAAHLVMNIDKLVGTDFEKGLAAMKAVCEGIPVEASASREVGVAEPQLTA